MDKLIRKNQNPAQYALMTRDQIKQLNLKAPEIEDQFVISNDNTIVRTNTPKEENPHLQRRNHENVVAGAQDKKEFGVQEEINTQKTNSYKLGGEFKKGGIYIKPENKGKFTETMKRTGKSARELLHSKNPLTRKRAQFAINSRKWKHSNGGEFIYFNN